MSLDWSNNKPSTTVILELAGSSHTSHALRSMADSSLQESSKHASRSSLEVSSSNGEIVSFHPEGEKTADFDEENGEGKTQVNHLKPILTLIAKSIPSVKKQGEHLRFFTWMIVNTLATIGIVWG